MPGSRRRQSAPEQQTGPLRFARTTSFVKDLKSLPLKIQDRTEETLRLLAQNPAHPSLGTKKLKGLKDIWEARVTLSYRITYQRTGDLIVLRRVGTHAILQTETR